MALDGECIGGTIQRGWKERGGCEFEAANTGKIRAITAREESWTSTGRSTLITRLHGICTAGSAEAESTGLISAPRRLLNRIDALRHATRHPSIRIPSHEIFFIVLFGITIILYNHETWPLYSTSTTQD